MRVHPGEERWRTQRDVATLLAWQALRENDRERAARELRPILRVEPTYEPDPNLYSPSLRALTAQAKEALTAEPRHKVVIETEPTGQQVFLDGRPFGPSPAGLSVPAGSYRLEVSWDGRPGVPRLLRVEEDAQLRLVGEVDGKVSLESGPCLEAGGSHRAEIADSSGWLKFSTSTS